MYIYIYIYFKKSNKTDHIVSYVTGFVVFL